MNDCIFCKEFNTEPNDISISEIHISSVGYYKYGCPINFCPYCGKKLKIFKKD